MDYTFLLGSLEGILGKSYKRARDNHAFACPFCNHKKPKLEINLRTNEEGKNFWECWVCQTRGQSIYSLLKQAKIPKSEADEILMYVRKGKKYIYRGEEVTKLPEEFQPLASATKVSVIANKVRRYLYERGLTDNDFIKYNVGYATDGLYAGRVIIPSYSSSNKLNYFIGRTYEGNYFKYKGPETDKNIIFFENLINWNQPIILVEGVFDAMAVKRNSIPILGKAIADSLLKRIITSDVEDIYIALDLDAQKAALRHAEELIKIGKKVFLVDLKQKDPSEMGFKAFTELIQSTKELDFRNLMLHKMNAI